MSSGGNRRSICGAISRTGSARENLFIAPACSRDLPDQRNSAHLLGDSTQGVSSASLLQADMKRNDRCLIDTLQREGSMLWKTIAKTARDRVVTPNLQNYEQARASLSWEDARRELEGLPEGRGLNIAHEAVDRRSEDQSGRANSPRSISTTINTIMVSSSV